MATLVILAAGRSTRFGRLKQLAPVGPGGEALLDYAIHDAALAGFQRVVLVIREQLRGAFEDHFRGGRAAPPVEILYAHQPLAHPELIPDPPWMRTATPGSSTGPLAQPELIPEAPPGRSGVADGRAGPARTRPWGTGFAVIAAGAGIGGKPLDDCFAVCNADDFYGRGAYAALAKHLTKGAAGTRAYTVGYPVGTTLSPAGGVSLGICAVDAKGALLQLTEGLNLCRDGDLASGHDPAGRPVTVALHAPVCTNLWGFQPDILPLLRERFAAFLAAGPGPDREFHLSEAINDLIALGQVRCTVLPTRERWMGVTFPGDLAGVAEALLGMKESGMYPPCLWSDPADP